MYGVLFACAALLILAGVAIRFGRQAQGRRLELERARKQLSTALTELQAMRDEVKSLSGLLPMCAWCKKIRNDSNYWQQVEVYISEHSDAQFSHGICPECYVRERFDSGGSS